MVPEVRAWYRYAISRHAALTHACTPEHIPSVPTSSFPFSRFHSCAMPMTPVVSKRARGDSGEGFAPPPVVVLPDLLTFLDEGREYRLEGPTMAVTVSRLGVKVTEVLDVGLTGTMGPRSFHVLQSLWTADPEPRGLSVGLFVCPPGVVLCTVSASSDDGYEIPRGAVMVREVHLVDATDAVQWTDANTGVQAMLLQKQRFVLHLPRRLCRGRMTPADIIRELCVRVLVYTPGVRVVWQDPGMAEVVEAVVAADMCVESGRTPRRRPAAVEQETRTFTPAALVSPGRAPRVMDR